MTEVSNVSSIPDESRINRLATFNSERGRGILHTEAWLDLMADEQEWWNQHQMSEMLAQGGEEVSPGVWMIPRQDSKQSRFFRMLANGVFDKR